MCLSGYTRSQMLTYRLDKVRFGNMLMKVSFFFFLLGVATSASFNSLRNLRDLLKKEVMTTKQHKWDDNAILGKRESPLETNYCSDIYTCPGFWVSEPAGSREEGFTFTMSVFEEICNYSLAIKQCYDESAFYQSCDSLATEMQSYTAATYLCGEPGRAYIQRIIPCINQRVVQHEIISYVMNAVENMDMENYLSCKFHADITETIFTTIGKYCTASALAAAESLNESFSVGTFLGIDYSHC